MCEEQKGELAKLELFTAIFCTPEPIEFHELDMDYDAVLEAVLSGESHVHSYNPYRYSDNDAVGRIIRENACGIIKECLDNWTAEIPIWRGREKSELVIASCFDKKLSEMGILAETRILSFSLTQDSLDLYNTIIKEFHTDERSAYERAWDHLDFGQHAITTGGSAVNGMIGTLMMNDYNKSTSDGTVPPSQMSRETDVGTDLAGESSRDDRKDKYCRQCGAKRTGNGKFCTHCGAMFDR